MAVGLTVMLALISVGILAGRVYEILKLTDLKTGFFIYKGIVFNPIILIIFAIIVICCGIIIFSGKNSAKPFFSKSSQIIAAASGAMLIIYGAMSAGNGPFGVFVIAGGAALLITGIFGLNPKASTINIAATALFVVFIVGLCLDIIVFNVNTIHNIGFVKNALASVTASVFMMFVMKNVYSPSQNSRMLLYITAMLAFVMCGIMNLADIIVMIAAGSAVLPDLFFNAGFAFLGFFALDNAVSVIPSRKIKAESDKDAENDIDNAFNEISVKPCSDVPENDSIEKSNNCVSPEGFSEPENIKYKKAATELFVHKEDEQTLKTKEKRTEKFIFSKKEELKFKTSAKSEEKVVYKRPKK